MDVNVYSRRKDRDSEEEDDLDTRTSERMKSRSFLPRYSADVLHRLQSKGKGGNTMLYMVAGIFAFGIFLTVVNIYELRKVQVDSGPEEKSGRRKQHVVCVWGKNQKTGYLKHVYNVFERIGYSIGTDRNVWDVLWSHDYPFKEFESQIRNLQPHQKVNHFPGTGYITNKVNLATSDIWFIPKAFKMPQDKPLLLKYSGEHPQKMWVQKSNNHRGIKIKKISDLDLSSGGTFVQEFVDKPFLIDRRKFDIGIYTTLTSIDPLRVYILDSEVLIRFCPQDYYPFDPENVDKYVVGDDYTPTWQMPSLKNIYEQNAHTHKETISTYLRQHGRNDTKLWDDIRQAIMEVYLSKEPNLIGAAKSYKSTRNFFEMVRFDFVVDEDLHIYLMEVNMSPNLSSGHFSQNKLLYEQVVFNLLSLVGVARGVTNSIYQSYTDEINMQVSSKDVQVFTETCLSPKCQRSCEDMECQLCEKCLTFDMRLTLQLAYMEHVDRRNCRRVFPPPMTQTEAKSWQESKDTLYMKSLNTKNKLMHRWFRGKCIMDPSWCQ
ncbi:tubulin polyglutamylase TTLL4 [Lingula anatina]|uniref:Tubulin polyglutamylase TTLL4 n=1 Tax=Lingula anatina TaxID=7574 RepID=A0A1S3J7I1_LINAN|nr:tubulin polyglutamylase TTLL4 [Lingula anatina]|eukprot:XP_013406367.1 tubulin polyglutamylase TTLL4 [Lingula anatina]